MEHDASLPRRATRRARLFAVAMLVALAAGGSYAAYQGYRAATDSFVAPVILSPDNDLVIASKVHATQLHVERSRTALELEAIDADLAAGATAITKLKELANTVKSGLAWTTSMNEQMAAAGASDLATLANQKAVLTRMIEKQTQLVRDAQANVEAGLVSKADAAREAHALSQMQVALLENDRTRIHSGLQVQQSMLAQKSLSSKGHAMRMPEQILRDEQLVRIELEILKLESEQRAKASEKALLEDKLQKLAAIEGQIKERPVFRASEGRIDAAFVPYTQIDGVKEGAQVLDCIWGAFHCKVVGKVAEVVPGEVVLPDPWGNQARGQYAVLALSRPDAARVKTLRIRGGAAKTSTDKRSERGERVSSR
jgi:hypothetical protein